MDRRARIEARLADALAAERVEVVDESPLHAGHAGARGGGGHFRALVVSLRFEGKRPLERQRLVYAALAAELAGEIERDWQAHGVHRAPGDVRRDQAVLHAANSESYAALVAAMDALRATERAGAPAFEIALAPH